MKTTPDADVQRWLTEDLRGDEDGLEWDAGNLPKLAKHGVEPEEVEGLLSGDIVFVGRILEPAHQEWRGLILGQTTLGRRLALVFTRRGLKLRPISCRAMRSAERRLYETRNETQA